MSRQQITNHYARLLTYWPLDRLRPQERHFQNLLRSRVQSGPPSHIDGNAEANAAYLLMDNAFAKQYRLSENVMKPASNPTHYIDLERELAEAPDRTRFGNFVNRIKNMVRFK
ncbi:hypothetical protein KC338_g5441 [Hortaea werneckii]|uniref:Uncharacterized protein n=1 Tax=Hortaea werneckii TaxID=91943 RepID=A0A3M7GE45_HORWE|nr:hypothetical protein KC338_g5441 [Hortaea werneckii]RMY99198.1 hypothetical protein D0862_07238 [Hortaea werneckii]